MTFIDDLNPAVRQEADALLGGATYSQTGILSENTDIDQVKDERLKALIDGNIILDDVTGIMNMPVSGSRMTASR